MRSIHLAGGCFWGLEHAFHGLPGVISTECGYVNGDPLFVPDYMLVCSGKFGYREAVCVDYDPVIISLEDILAVFFLLIDPTQERRQGNDVGIQYQTGVYWTDSDSEDVIRRVFAEQESLHSEFHVEMGPLTFWSPAEEYHQEYLEKNPNGYCHIPAWKVDMVRGILDSRRHRSPRTAAYGPMTLMSESIIGLYGLKSKEVPFFLEGQV